MLLVRLSTISLPCEKQQEGVSGVDDRGPGMEQRLMSVISWSSLQLPEIASHLKLQLGAFLSPGCFSDTCSEP
jgi:hypothetical protein